MEKRCTKCDTDIAQTISDCSIKSNLKNCQYINTETFVPIKETKFDGTKTSFEICLGNVFADPKLREYGLRYIVPFILKNLPDLWLCEDLENVAEILIIHECIVLLRVSNSKENLDKVLEIHVNRILKEMETGESNADIETETTKSYYLPEIHPFILMISDFSTQVFKYSNHIIRNPIVIAAVVGVSVGVLTYWKLKRF